MKMRKSSLSAEALLCPFTHSGERWRAGPVLCLYLGRLVGIWRLSCGELGRLDDAFHVLVGLCQDTERQPALAPGEVREQRGWPTWAAAHLACRWEVSCRCWFRCLEIMQTFSFSSQKILNMLFRNEVSWLCSSYLPSVVVFVLPGLWKCCWLVLILRVACSCSDEPPGEPLSLSALRAFIL